MPFTIGGDWIPKEEPSSSSSSSKSSKPVKVRKEKRRQSIVTVILNLPESKLSLKELAAALKRRCGCGGTVKDGVIELQGDRVDAVREELKGRGIKSQ